MAEIAGVKDLKVKWNATPSKTFFAEKVELSNAIIFGVVVTSFYTCINHLCNIKVQPTSGDKSIVTSNQPTNKKCY